MRRQIRGLERGALNSLDGISLLQVADGALSEVADMIQRMNELAVYSANGTNSQNDRMAIQNEVDQLISEVGRISDTTVFNDRLIFKNVLTQTVNDAQEGTGVNSDDKTTMITSETVL